MSSTFGKLFRVTTFGESHCRGVGAVVDGCPANITLSKSEIQAQLDRRRPGQSKLSTDRNETDQVTVLSGVENNLTLGTPISLFVPNKDQRPGDYKSMRNIPRPSHADYTYQMKYGIRSSSGGGRSSARETIGRVAAGAVAEKILMQMWGVSIVAWVSRVGTTESKDPDMETITRKLVDATPVRCPDPDAALKMMDTILKVKESKDSIGGVVTCVCRHLQAGWGEPVFEKLEAILAQAMLSIPATKGFEIGSGFKGSTLTGSIHNDPFEVKKGRLGTKSNRNGGIQGGISNGENIYFKVAFKPPATIGLPQHTVDFDGKHVELSAAGRHDPCVVNRAVPIVESMAALVLADMALRQKARRS